MEKNEILKKVRRILHDTTGEIWEDSELEGYIEESAEEYSKDSRLYIGRFDFLTVSGEEHGYPEDFITYICGWNEDGRFVIPGEIEDVPDHSRRGVAEVIYDDGSNSGEYRLWPRPYQETEEDETSGGGSDEYVFKFDFGEGHSQEDPEDYASKYGVSDFLFGGEDKDSGLPYGTVLSIQGTSWTKDYGTEKDEYGVSIDEYGTYHTGKEYSYIGDGIYNRFAGIEEIRDYTALIYLTISKAYLSRSDRENAQMGSMFHDRYKGRISKIVGSKAKRSGKRRCGIYY